MCSPYVLWCNMYQDLLKLRTIMYLGITESKNTSTSQHILDGECHAMPLSICRLPPVHTHPATSHSFMTCTCNMRHALLCGLSYIASYIATSGVVLALPKGTFPPLAM